MGFGVQISGCGLLHEKLAARLQEIGQERGGVPKLLWFVTPYSILHSI